MPLLLPMPLAATHCLRGSSAQENDLGDKDAATWHDPLRIAHPVRQDGSGCPQL